MQPWVAQYQAAARAAMSLEDVAAITGHRTTATTRHFYDEADAVPFMAVLPMRLIHPDDPAVER